MQENDHSELTRQTYDAFAEEWTTSEEQIKPFWEAELKTFQELLPRGHIIEIGAGGGRDAAILTGLGYEYTGVDNSEGMLKAARAAHPGITFLRRDALSLDLPPGSTFDGFWCAAVLLHLPKKDAPRALQEIHRAVKPGAIGMITMRLGKDEGLRERVKHGKPDKRYFAHYTEQEFSGILRQNGFSVLKVTSRPEGTQYTWLAFFVKKV